MANKKSIPSPPGGQLTCSDDQLAIVEVRNGEVFAECHSQPARTNDSNLRLLGSVDKKLSALNWALTLVTGIRRATLQPLSEHDHEILANKRYEWVDVSSGEVTVTDFELPAAIRPDVEGGTEEPA